MSTKYLKKPKLTNYQQVNNKVYVNKREEICFNTLFHSKHRTKTSYRRRMRIKKKNFLSE